MAKYYYDTEFIEGPQESYSFLGLKTRTIFFTLSMMLVFIFSFYGAYSGKNYLYTLFISSIPALLYLLYGISISTKPTIDLISIAFVSDDEREYYAISKDFNLRDAWNRYDIKTEQVYGDQRNIFPEGKNTKVYWIRENVLKPIFLQWVNEANDKIERLGLQMPLFDYDFNYGSFKAWLESNGKTNEEIAREIIDFVNPDLLFPVASYNNSEVKPGGRLYDHFDKHNVGSDGEYYYAQPEFYGYYSSYDHVVLCWLFGKMIDLPKGFPMYTIDLKQIFDEKQRRMNLIRETKVKESKDVFEKDGFLFVDRTEYDLKKMTSYPSNKQEHSALGDAKFNKELHEFLSNV